MTADKRKKETRRAAQRRAKVLGVGPDGRNIYTKDPAARGGKRSATNSRPAGLYVGRELHLGAAVPALKNTDTTSWVAFGPDVPLVVLLAKLVPAGTHPCDAVRDSILEAHSSGFCEDVIPDPGYTLKLPETLLWPLQQAGIPITLRPKSWQQGERGAIGGQPLLDGQLFSEHVPQELRELRLPGRNVPLAEREASMREFERRAAFRMGLHKGPGPDGTTRWKCPFCGGRLRSRALDRTIRRSRKGALVDLPVGATCCDGILLAGADQLPLMQPTIVGTRAWWVSWGRRNPVETENGQVQGEYIDIDKGYVRLLDSGRITGLLAYGIAGLNRWMIHNWKRDHQLLSPDHPDALPPERKKRQHRQERVARFEDLPVRANSPPPLVY